MLMTIIARSTTTSYANVIVRKQDTYFILAFMDSRKSADCYVYDLTYETFI